MIHRKLYFGKKGGCYFPSLILAYTCSWHDLTVLQCENWATENELVYCTDGFQADFSYLLLTVQ